VNQQHENLCRVIYETLEGAKKQFRILEGRDRFALQQELLEWLSGDWEEMDVDWSPELKEGDQN
jgi:hypothetical protein